MRSVYLSFLGTGKYEETTYVFSGKPASPTRFIQAAQLELLGTQRPDQAYILVTRESRQMHFRELRDELASFTVQVQPVELDEDMSEKGQWEWFETILNLIQPGDQLMVDLTHGFRSMPIIFSTALNFLQKTRQVTLKHVFYGAFEQNKEQPPIIDMRKFYDINLWADGVSRLVEDADAASLASMAGRSAQGQFPELADAGFTETCKIITRQIKSIDINNVGQQIHNLLQHIQTMRRHASPGTTMLLDMVEEKFIRLQVEEMGNPDKKGYELPYYRMLLELCRLLLDHGLIMQAFTVMREWVGSLVMLHFEQHEKMNAGKRRKKIQRYGQIFFNMLQFHPEKWDFSGQQNKLDKIKPFYDTLREQKILDPLLDADPLPAKTLSVYRNGFDHAWLGKAAMKQDIEEVGRAFLARLEDVLHRLEEQQEHQSG